MSAAVPAALDACVARVLLELAERVFPTPRALLLLGTGVALLPERLADVRVLDLSGVGGVPAPWRSTRLFGGRLDKLSVWLLDDLVSDPASHALAEPWEAGFPCWLAARAGAALLVHTSAGCALPRNEGAAALERGALVPGSLAVIRDHINLSGHTPLLGLGASQLGPLFPDVSRLHHVGLRRACLARAESLGLRAVEAVVACTQGPSLETPAERRFLARAGAEIAVQGLAAPLLAAAHAGLSVLALVALTEDGQGPSDVAHILAATQRAAPQLEELLSALGPDLAAADKALRAARETP